MVTRRGGEFGVGPGTEGVLTVCRLGSYLGFWVLVWTLMEWGLPPELQAMIMVTMEGWLGVLAVYTWGLTWDFCHRGLW